MRLKAYFWNPILLFVLLTLVGILLACGGTRSPEEKSEDKLLDQLTLFVEAVQGERWDRAMNLLSPPEKNRLLTEGGNGSGELSESAKFKLKAMKLSTLAHRGLLRLDAKDKLEGIADALPKEINPPPVDSITEVPSFQ